MFRDSYPVQGSGKVCRPDPEEILESIRNRKDEASKARNHLIALAQSSFFFETKDANHIISAMLGEIMIKEINLNREEERILEEINKEAANGK